MSMSGWGPKMAPCCSASPPPPGGTATLLSGNMTASLASTPWVSDPVTSKMCLCLKMCPDWIPNYHPFFIHLFVKFVFHVKYIIFFSNQIFAKFLLVLHGELAHQPSVPFGEWSAQCDGYLSFNKEPRPAWEWEGHLAWGSIGPLFFEGYSIFSLPGGLRQKGPVLLVKVSNSLAQNKHDSCSFWFLNKLLVYCIINCSWL